MSEISSLGEFGLIDHLTESIKLVNESSVKGVGHVNVDVDETLEGSKTVETMGCTDCNKNAMACSVPTLHDGVHELD